MQQQRNHCSDTIADDCFFQAHSLDNDAYKMTFFPLFFTKTHTYFCKEVS